ncbi:host attachment family protein [Sphingomonas bacterium]|uniref:host attachment family protein n=1 Tax=Sphingomonas bacterium TaxID=1895847 RepID=UPI00157705B3|nr:host attachment family protein [Sphingomonas bacterium]
MQVAYKAVVLVADGRKLLFLRNQGDAAHPDLQVETAQEHPNPKDGDQASDAAGRASPGGGGGGGSAGTGSSVSATDFHQLEEDRFAAQAAEMLKRRVLAHDFEELIVVAPPRTLGELRKHYHVEVSRRLIGELAKDLTGHSIVDIERALAAA